MESREQTAKVRERPRVPSDSERLVPIHGAAAKIAENMEASLSLLGKVPLTNARLLIHDAGRLGLKSLYERAGLPTRLLPAFREAVDVSHETLLDG